MIEQPPRTEQGIEKHPSEVEVGSLFERLNKGREFIEIKKEFDSIGLKNWEICVTNEDGSTTEYVYGRKVEYGEENSVGKINNRIWTQIQMAHFDKNGMPEGGGLVAELRNGEWVDIV